MAKSFVTLMRHAKSSWQNAEQSDYDRPLNPRGMSDAPMMAQRLIEKRCIPDLILCSSARRAHQTGEYLVSALELPDDQFQIIADLYLASPETLLSALAQVEVSVNHVLLIAHNPGLAQLSSLLAPESSPHMATAGIRHFSWPDTDSTDEPALIFEDYPKNHNAQ